MSDPAAKPRRPLIRYGVVALILAVGIGALALYGIGGGDKTVACAASPQTLGAIKAAASGQVAGVVTPSSPRAVPPLVFKDANGADLGLDRFHGKVVLLNLWATWCTPCRKEMPSLDRLQGERGGPDFEVVPVSLDIGSLDKPKGFLKEIGASRIGLYADPSGKTFQSLKQAGRLTGLPTTLILDRAGCEIGYLPGPAEWAGPEALALIDAALGK